MWGIGWLIRLIVVCIYHFPMTFLATADEAENALLPKFLDMFFY